jgi:hypothetical protein
MRDQRVLLICQVDGSSDQTAYRSAAAVYDAATNEFQAATAPSTSNTGAATLLPDGRVLLTGTALRVSNDPAEILDPRTGTSRELAITTNPGHSIPVGLSDGRVIFFHPEGTTADVFDPASESFSTIALPAPLGGGNATRLSDDRVLIVFASDSSLEAPSPMIFDPNA